MGCGCCKEKPRYENGTPLVSGGTVTECFSTGRLFKIEKGSKWYFYNDTQDSKMRVTADFGAGSVIVPGKSAKATSSNADGSCTVVLEIPPLDTMELCKVKEVNGYKVVPNASYFSDREQAQFRADARQKAAGQLQTMDELAKKKGSLNAHMLLAQAREKGKPFVDVFFPPTDTSLYRPGKDQVPQGSLRNLTLYCWRRPEDYLPSSWKDRIQLLKDVDPSDIGQGLLGDCYFLCACSALAEHSNHIKGIFKNDRCCLIEKKEQKLGGWRVTLNIHGWWRQIIVDSYLPSTSLLPSFARNRHHPNQLWISFLEKAYAKAYGSYQSIVAGFAWQALEDLTGFPAYCFGKEWAAATTDKKACETLFTKLQDWCDDNYLLSIGTPVPGTSAPQLQGLNATQAESFFSKIGLATGHAYSVLDVKHFPLHGLCMLKIRNPWGDGTEWNGDWGDNSELWGKYPFIKLACKPQKKEDGIFWMEWKDVVKYFDSGCVCFRKGNWHSSWHHYTVPGAFSGLHPDTALEIVTEKNFKGFVTLHQKDKRGLADSDPDSKYASVMVSLAKGGIDGGRLDIVTNSAANPKEPASEFLFQVSRSVGLYHSFEKGSRYLVVPRRMQSGTGNNNATKRYTISLISDEKVSGSKLKVNFVTLGKSCKVFDNLTAFESGTLTGIDTVFQVKSDTDLFETKKGTSFGKGSTKKNAKFETVM